jgi:hypothetical protein
LLKVALNIISPNPIFSFSLYADDRILFQNLKALFPTKQKHKNSRFPNKTLLYIYFLLLYAKYVVTCM